MFPDDHTPSPAALHIRQTLAEARGTVFAVLDGALYDGLGSWVEQTAFRARPLFRQADASLLTEPMVEAGPWLIALDDTGQIEGAIALCGPEIVPVLWDWTLAEDALVAHIRHFILIEMPNDREPPGDHINYITAVFRHWDPVVMATIWPVFTPQQQARIVPRAAAIALVNPDTGLREWLDHTPAPIDPNAPREGRFLRLTPEQYEVFDVRHRAPGLAAAVDDLRALLSLQGNTPPDDATLREAVEDADWMADQYDLEEQNTMVALAAWQIIQGRDSDAFAAMIDAIVDPLGDGSADERVYGFLEGVERDGSWR